MRALESFTKPGHTVDHLVWCINNHGWDEEKSGQKLKDVKGRIAEYVFLAWGLMKVGPGAVGGRLDKDGECRLESILTKAQVDEIRDRHPFFSRVRRDDQTTARIFDVVVYNPETVDWSTDEGILWESVKFNCGCDDWLGKLVRTCESWEEEEAGDEEEAQQAAQRASAALKACGSKWLCQLTQNGHPSTNVSRRCGYGCQGDAARNVKFDWRVEVDEHAARTGQSLSSVFGRLAEQQESGVAAQMPDMPGLEFSWRGWQVAAVDTLVNGVFEAPPGFLYAGDVVAPPSAGKTDVIKGCLDFFFEVVCGRGAGVHVLMIHDIFGAGRLVDKVASMDCDVYVLNSSSTGGCESKDNWKAQGIKKINATVNEAGLLTDPKVHTRNANAVEEMKKMEAATRPTVIVCTYCSARVLLQLAHHAKMKPFRFIAMDEVHRWTRPAPGSTSTAAHYLPCSHALVGITGTAIAPGSGPRKIIKIDDRECERMGISAGTERLMQLEGSTPAWKEKQQQLRQQYHEQQQQQQQQQQQAETERLGRGLPDLTEEEWDDVIVAYFFSVWGNNTAWLDLPRQFVLADEFDPATWGGRILHPECLSRVGREWWCPVLKITKDTTTSTTDVDVLKTVRASKVVFIDVGGDASKGYAAQVRTDQGKVWVVAKPGAETLGTFFGRRGSLPLPKNNFGTCLPVGDETTGVVPANAYWFKKKPAVRPLAVGLSMARSVEMGYSVPVRILIPYMDASCLPENDELVGKIAGGKVTGRDGTCRDSADELLAETVYKLFDELPYSNRYPRYGNQRSFHLKVKCSGCKRADNFYELLESKLRDLCPDRDSGNDVPVFVGVAHCNVVDKDSNGDRRKSNGSRVSQEAYREYKQAR